MTDAEKIVLLERELQELRGESMACTIERQLYEDRMSSENSREARQWRTQREAQNKQEAVLQYISRMITEDSEEAKEWRALRAQIDFDSSKTLELASKVIQKDFEDGLAKVIQAEAARLVRKRQS
jgi:hypothetical protein